jgi:hypothetical protein
MKVKELIEALEELPPEKKIVVRGYEDGYNDILELKPVKIKHNAKAEWYYGEYATSDSQDAIDAIELYGKNTNEEIKHKSSLIK